MQSVDTELRQLNLSDQLRGNSSFMKVMATLFHYGNQPMNAAQLVVAVRALDLLPLRGETPKSTIQGIISTSRKAARDLKQPDPFDIVKDGPGGRQTKYAIAESVLSGAELPAVQDIPDQPIVIKPVEHSSSYTVSYTSQLGKRDRKHFKHRRPGGASMRKRKRSGGYDNDSDGNISDMDADSEDEDCFVSAESGGEEADSQANSQFEEDTIFDYSLLYAPPPTDMDYIDAINFAEYPKASYFAAVQQKGYSYPRFRSHEKIKIPKAHCEDKFRVTDIVREKGESKEIVGRLFILADGHGGPGCSEYFVRNTPAAIQTLCASYDPTQFAEKETQLCFERDVKRMVEQLDEKYLAIKRVQHGWQSKDTEDVDMDAVNDPLARKHDGTDSGAQNNSTTVNNDGCTLVLNIFFGDWMINVNVGDSRTILLSAPEPGPTPVTYPVASGVDKDYLMEVVFASQDHKPYLEHLAREILENGGEFVDSVQNRVIKVELDKLREDGNRQAKRVALKNARIRPKDYQSTIGDQHNGDTTVQSWAAQSAVRTTANNYPARRAADDRIPSLNVARSCGDLDFKMDSKRKIISCEPDVTFLRISDSVPTNSIVNGKVEEDSNTTARTILTCGPRNERRRHFLFMSTDGTFDYMYEETPERQNRAIAKAIGAMIEDGEKIGSYILEQEKEAQTIEHTSNNPDAPDAPDAVDAPENGVVQEAEMSESQPEEQEQSEKEEKSEKEENKENEEKEEKTEDEQLTGKEPEESALPPPPPPPLLFRELTEQEERIRKIKERTLSMTARYFANRESAHGFFSSKLQDYDDCTVLLIEI
ncbi:hypothetical protein DFQ28_008981 [Apophysomyces sp. BC1034]|nr:hypothetical protein DFQ30_001597 [Apophysomyces sp. BC1015]KAG0180379.1 hypothetical protein DFQ29_000774 [Apophysomyces sp. BC1021]KAG0192482.1 hypothetical protein DFQ28_008981 [Apophysomyces sp. BC1034]